jgi:hypothetical protein
MNSSQQMNSEFGITIVQWTSKIEVVYSDSFERILYSDAVMPFGTLVCYFVD